MGISKDEAMAWINTEIEKLTNALTKGFDLVMIVIRFHLIIENLLERIILVETKRGDKIIENGGLSFNQKLLMVESFDIIGDSYIQAIKNLNSLRNKCAHEAERIIVINDIDRIGRPLGSHYTKIRSQYFSDLQKLIVALFSDIFTKLLAVVAQKELRIPDAP